MNESKQNRRRRRAKKRRRQVLILRTILLLLCILVLIAIIVLLRNAVSSSSPHSAVPSDSSLGNETLPDDPSTPTQPAPTDEPQLLEQLTLTDADRHTGNLILVNSGHPYDFDANAASVNLVNIKEQQSISYPVDKDEFQVAGRMLPQLDAMIAACNNALGVTDTSISSAYRSKEYQENVYRETEETYGKDYADQYVSTPGYSEHHTGLAVDLGITNADGLPGSFSESPNAIWMDDHSWEYGFVRRYKEDKVSITGISNESWHFRYVGVPHAKYMKEQNLALEEYIDYLTVNTSKDAPLTVTHGDQTWIIYYTTENTIPKPDHNYEISGNNVDGCIITVEAS